jgi:serine/threonine protein phosphatase PrpC
MLVFSDGLFDILEDQREWWREVGRLVADHPDPASTLAAVRELTAAQVNLDDVTAVVVHRSAGAAR